VQPTAGASGDDDPAPGRLLPNRAVRHYFTPLRPSPDPINPPEESPMSRVSLVLALLVLLPAAATAQRGGGGTGAAGGATSGGGFGGKGGQKSGFDAEKNAGPRAPSISGKDFEKASPLADLLDKKKDLKLTDAQVTAMKEADIALRAANTARYKLVDSLRRDLRPGTSAEDEARVVLAREAMMGVVRDIRASYDAAVKDAVAKLDEGQQKTAQDVLQKNAEDLQEMLRDKMGGRGGAPAGRGRGGAL
jgi:hypothetical protein